MKNINYKYNPNTLDYEEVKLSFWDKIKKLSYYLIASVVLSVLIISFSFYNTKSYIQKEAAKENQSLRQQISVLNKDLNLVLDVLNEIQNKDDNIYRAIFEADPYPEYKRKLGTGGNPIKFKKYENIEYGDLVVEVLQKMELIEKKLASQSKSFDEVFEITKEKQKMLQAIPSIQPINSNCFWFWYENASHLQNYKDASRNGFHCSSWNRNICNWRWSYRKSRLDWGLWQNYND